jgi:4-amino-4-deoxy-L-arabinose transferase
MKKIIFLTGVCFLFIYIIPLGIRPLVIPDEVRYAEIPREILASGDWIVPHLNGLQYFEKPVMGYWLNGFAIKIFGENAFAVRFFSAVSAGLSALMVFFLSSRFENHTRKGVVAAIVYLTFFLVYGLGVFNVLDGMFSVFLTACTGFFFMAWSCRDHLPSYYGYLILTGIFCGFAFLTKGFLAFAIPISIIVPFLIWEKNYKMIFQASWIPILTALTAILPWAVLIHFKAPDFWNFFFWHEHVKRFFSEGAQHKESFFFFFMVLPAALLPWTFLVPASIAGLREKGLKSPLLRYALCWFTFPFLLLSISSGKLSTYILPCFPALAILLSIGLIEYLDSQKTYWFDKGVLFLMGFMGLLIVTLFILQTGIIDSLHPYAYENQWKAALFFTALIGFIFFLKKSLTAQDNTRKILLFAAAPLIFYFSAHFLIPDKTVLRKCPGDLIQRNKDRIDKNVLIFSPPTPVLAVCWFLKRDNVSLLARAGELEYGLAQKGSRNRILGYEQFYQLARKNSGLRKIAFVVDQREYARIKNSLPKPMFMDSSGNDGFAFIIF